jgi:hypothetical protein
MDDKVVVDWSFVNQQLDASDLSDSRSVLVRKILHVLEQVGLTHDESTNLTDGGVLEAVQALINGHAIAVDSREVWADAQPGEIAKGNRVRVKPDAYDDRIGVMHNGRQGRVVTLRNGKIGVVYDGENPDTAPQHEVWALQKLV